MLRNFYFPVSLGAIIRLSLGTTMVRWAVESLFMRKHSVNHVANFVN